MITIPEQALSTRRPREKKCEDVLIGFLNVAGWTGEHQVVAAVVGSLPASGSNVIERDTLHAYPSPAVSAHGSMSVEQPLPGVGVGVSARRQRGVLLRGPTCAFLTRPAGAASGTQLFRDLMNSFGISPRKLPARRASMT
jgi:hypothetical protein